MSKIALTPDASGTGTFVIASPNSNTNRTLTLPDSSGTLATAESTLSQFNAAGSAPVYACRAWVNFNGTGTVAIRASGNVSSITDNGTGDYTVNFTTPMPDVDYASVATGGGGAGLGVIVQGDHVSARTTTTLRLVGLNNTGTVLADAGTVSVSIFR